MSEDNKFTGSIPDIYDDYLVPLIFEGYARDLAERIAAEKPESVLETAAGSGVVTRQLAPMLSGDASYLVTDLNSPMIERAKARQKPDHRLSWQAADALKLPCDDGSFDAILCQFGVMFFPDRAAGFAEARRALREGGTFSFNVWDRLDTNDFPCVVVEAASLLFQENPPLFLDRVPHGYHDKDQIAEDLREGGFSNFTIDTLSLTSKANAPQIPAFAYCQGTPMRNELEALDANLNQVTSIVEEALSRSFGTSQISGPIQAHIVTAQA